MMDDLVLALSRLTAGEREQAAAKKEFFKEAGFLLNLVADLFSLMGAEQPGGDRAVLNWVETALDDSGSVNSGCGNGEQLCCLGVY
jgi:predicted NUDIX family NTP pyrophosphohydrolase